MLSRTWATIFRAAAASVLLSALSAALAAPRHGPSPDAAAVTVLAGGDILLDRGVGQQIALHGNRYPFALVEPITEPADIVFANLECPVSANGVKTIKRFSFRAKPATVGALVDGHVTIVSQANNHAMDCNRAGLMETLGYLKQHGILWCGAGKDGVDAAKPTIVTVHGIRIAFVGFCEFLPEGIAPLDDAPTMQFATEENVRNSVTAARKVADVVVASFHWGIEYRVTPTDFQTHLAHVAAECGADLVLGHHPHVLEGIEIVPHPGTGRRTLIIYSLGSFVFDPLPGRPANTALLECRISKLGVESAKLVPLQIVDCRPRPATAAESAKTLREMRLLSGALGTTIDGPRIVLPAR